MELFLTFGPQVLNHRCRCLAVGVQATINFVNSQEKQSLRKMERNLPRVMKSKTDAVVHVVGFTC